MTGVLAAFRIRRADLSVRNAAILLIALGTLDFRDDGYSHQLKNGGASVLCSSPAGDGADGFGRCWLSKIEQLNSLTSLVEDKRRSHSDQRNIVSWNTLIRGAEALVPDYSTGVVGGSAFVVVGGTSANCVTISCASDAVASCHDPILGDDAATAGMRTIVLKTDLVWDLLYRCIPAADDSIRFADQFW